MSTLQSTKPRHEAWPELTLHQDLVLQDARGNRIEGTLDGMTTDRSTLWIQLKGGLGRQLVHHQDGYWLEAAGA
ncbi:hypothetical protein ACIQC5_01550 [Paenarthrobacter sp. NPDC092416]|uniref:hypothetical protein n=1 Tax=Paenarthrobacter sp. NPDC092416 TaxID=3364386 RepID=UPI0038149303